MTKAERGKEMNLGGSRGALGEMKMFKVGGQNMSKRILKIILCAVTFGVILSHSAYAELPGVKTRTTALVDPSTADSYYGGFFPFGTHTPPIDPSYATPLINELAIALGANRLPASQFTKNVYEYIKNNIEVEFRYGLAKGARGAILDQSGTPFDQAHLMVELLKIGGISAEYRIGSITVTLEQFGKWSGLITNLDAVNQTFDVNAKSACQFLADGGIPAIVEGTSSASCSYTGNLSQNISVGHIWVVSNGLAYDPSFKEHRFKGKIDLPSAMNCGTELSPTCGTSAESALLTGAGPYTSYGTNPNSSEDDVTYYQNLNTTALATNLTAKAVSMQGYLQSNMPDAELDDVIGGQEIIQVHDETISSSTAYGDINPRVISGDLPDQYRTSLRVQFDNINQTLFVDEIFDQQIRLVGDVVSSTRTVELKLEHRAIATSERLDATASNDTLILDVNHPYASGATQGTYMDEVYTFHTMFHYVAVVDHGSIPGTPLTYDRYGELEAPITIAHGWGQSGRGALRYQSQRQIRRQKGWGDGLYNDYRYGADHQVVISDWLAQSSEAVKISGQMNETKFQQHHSVGYIRSGGKYGAPQLLNIETRLSNTSAYQDNGDKMAAQFTVASLLNRLEGALQEIGNDAWEGASAVSLFGRANEKSHKFLHVTSDNKTTVSNMLINYSAYREGLFTNYTTGSGLEAIVLQNSILGEFQNLTTGSGIFYPYPPFYVYNTDGSNASHLLAFSDIIAKGSASHIPPLEEQKYITSVNQADYLGKGAQYYGVDQASGRMTLNPAPDLVTGAGDFPYSLHFQRLYTSGNSLVTFPEYQIGSTTHSLNVRKTDSSSPSAGKIGRGWTHNFQITASIGGDVYQAMGEDSAIDAIDLITSMYVLKDIYKQGLGFSHQLTSIFVTDWWGRELRHAKVTITQGASSQAFMRLPDGVSYNPPPSSIGTVAVSGNFPEVDYGKTPSYNYVNKTILYKDGSGSTMNFDKGDYSVPSEGWEDKTYKPILKITNWTFPTGVILDFTYEEQSHFKAPLQHWYPLKMVSNNLGRSLTFDNWRYFGFSRVEAVTDDFGRTVTISNNSSSLKVTKPDYSEVIYKYEADADHDLISEMYLADNSITPYATFSYDSDGKITSIQNAEGNITRYFIPSISTEIFKRSEVLDTLGNSRYFIFDQNNALVSYISPTGAETSHEYDGRGRLISTTFPEGNSAAYEYDSHHNKTKITVTPKPSSGEPVIEKRATYNLIWNKPNWVRDANGNETDIEYYQAGVNGAGQPKVVTQPAALSGAVRGTYQYEYNALGQLTKETDPEGMITTFDYQSAYSLLASTTVDAAPGGKQLKTVYFYDKIGRACRTVDPRGSSGLTGGYDANCDVDISTSPPPPPPVANSDPVAVDDAVVVTLQESYEVDVLGNDSDPDNDPLTITSAVVSGTQITATIGCSSTCLNVVKDTTEVRTVTYTITDGNGGSDSAVLTVTGSAPPTGNSAPVAVDDAVNVTLGANHQVNVLFNDSDPDNDPLTITDAVVSNTMNFTATIGCSATCLIVNKAIVAMRKVTYTISDGNGRSDTAVLTVTGNNHQ